MVAELVSLGEGGAVEAAVETTELKGVALDVSVSEVAELLDMSNRWTTGSFEILSS